MIRLLAASEEVTIPVSYVLTVVGTLGGVIVYQEARIRGLVERIVSLASRAVRDEEQCDE